MQVSRHLLTLGLLTTLGLGLPRVSPVFAEEPHRLAQSSVNRDFEPIDIRGRLDETSLVLDDGRYFNIYPFEGIEGQQLIIDLISDDFDAHLLLVISGDEVELITEDSYGGENGNAQIVVVLPKTGVYEITATSAQGEEIGDYRLTAQMATSSDLERAELLEEANRLNEEATELYEEGRYQEAIPIAQQALQIRETTLGESHPNVAQSLNSLAKLYQAQAYYGAAEPLYLQALEIRETALGESHPDVAYSLMGLANLYQAQAYYGAAEPLYLRALEIRETALGESHPDVAYSLMGLANLYQAQAYYGAAEPLYLQALEIRETALGESHPDVAYSLNSLANLYSDQGNYDAAETLYLRALEILETRLGESHPAVAASLIGLANLYLQQGNLSAVEPLLHRSLEILETGLEESHPDVAYSLNSLANLYSDQGNYDAAETLYLRALEILETRLGESHPAVAASLMGLANLYLQQRNFSAVEPLLHRSLEILETGLEESHPAVAYSFMFLGGLYFIQGNLSAAEPLFHRSLGILEASLGESHPHVAYNLIFLANIYIFQNELSAAESIVSRIFEIVETSLEKFHYNLITELIEPLHSIAYFYLFRGNSSAAEALHSRTLEIIETTLGESHPDVVTSLNNLATFYHKQGNDSAAEALYRRALGINETAWGESHPNVVPSLNNLAAFYQEQRNYGAAKALYRRALEINETAWGESHPNVIPSLNNLADFYQSIGNIREGEPLHLHFLIIQKDTRQNFSAVEALYRRALEISETAWGESHPNVVPSLNNLIAFYQNLGDIREAEPLHLRVLTIRENTLGGSHPDVASTINDLAVIYLRLGNYRVAEALYRRAFDILETAMGESNPEIVPSLRNLAAFYQEQGNYSAAEILLNRVLKIQETTLGEFHIFVALDLIDLAKVHFEQGNYSEAQSVWRRILDMVETYLEESNTIRVQGLMVLAGIHFEQGNFNDAEPLLHRALEIQETTLGESHPDVVLSLNSLAALYQKQGNYSTAESLLHRALEIGETPQRLQRLAELYQEQGNYTAAEPLLRRALEIDKGPYRLELLAELYHRQGNYSAAEPLYRQAFKIYETTWGDSAEFGSRFLRPILIKLLGFYQDQGNISESLSVLQRILDIEETRQNDFIRRRSESSLTEDPTRVLESRREDPGDILPLSQASTHQTLSLHLQQAPDDSEVARLALTTIFRRKGRILDAVTETQQLIREQLSPEMVEDYTNAQTRLANRLYAGLGDQDPNLYRAQIYALRQQVEQLEKNLYFQVHYRLGTPEPVEIEAVQALIPPDAALVELVQYRPWSQGWGKPRYAAYVLHASGDPQWVDLGDAETIDNSAFAFLNATRVSNSQQWTQTTGRQLDELLMAPIRPLLGDATHLLLSPDGQLNLIPFAALVDEENRYLVESYQLTHLTTGRDLLRLQYPRPSRQPPVLFANPDYDDADTSAVAQVARATRGESQRSMEIEELQFGELPGTQREVEAIAPLLDNPIILTGAEATENALKQVQAPSILHLATHGFFLQDVEFVPPRPITDFTRGNIDVVTAGPLGGWFRPPSDRPTSSENPLLRSGLAFAGFNTRDSEGEDGVLTALEAVGLDLRGTRLVVMSACETGVGDVANGEGVYGLRRALVMAGAESQLMSLWKVADEETADLMRDYYQRLLAGEGRSEALREVQLDWLERGKHPYYWASFLFSGQWTPMD